MPPRGRPSGRASLPIAARPAPACWPGPRSISLLAAAGVDRQLVREWTVTARWPAASPAADQARALGHSLAATSADLRGALPAQTGAQVRARLRTPPDLRFLAAESAAVGGVPATLTPVERARCRVARLRATAEAGLLRVLDAPCGD